MKNICNSYLDNYLVIIIVIYKTDAAYVIEFIVLSVFTFISYKRTKTKLKVVHEIASAKLSVNVIVGNGKCDLRNT